MKEVATLDRNGAKENIRADDNRVVRYLAAGNKVIDTMMTGKIKYGAKHEELELKNRCVLRGDQMGDVVTDNEKTSPTVRCEGVKCCEANKCLRGQSEICFDYTGAYLQGKGRRLVIARAPIVTASTMKTVSSSIGS